MQVNQELDRAAALRKSQAARFVSMDAVGEGSRRPTWQDCAGRGSKGGDLLAAGPPHRGTAPRQSVGSAWLRHEADDASAIALWSSG